MPPPVPVSADSVPIPAPHSPAIQACGGFGSLCAANAAGHSNRPAATNKTAANNGR